MKPEHFIYKSDGLYYMQNMPVVPDDRDAESLGAYINMMRQYYKALERAKAEAVRICDEHQEILKKKIYDADPGRNTGVDTYFKGGEIYTINMEEKIEVVEDPEFPGFDHTSYPTFRKIARIAAPKNENPFKLVEMCNFPEDYAYENGNYINKCHSCGFYFKGHKRRVTCKMCSEFTLEEWKKIAAMKTPEDTKHAHAGCWLQGEMVGYARCMVKWLESAPKKEAAAEEYANKHDHHARYDKGAFLAGAKWQSEQDNQALSSALKEIAELHAKIKELESKPNNFM